MEQNLKEAGFHIKSQVLSRQQHLSTAETRQSNHLLRDDRGLRRSLGRVVAARARTIHLTLTL